MRLDHINLPKQDVLLSLLRLIEAGLAQAFRYEANLGEYLKIQCESATLSDWYYITKAGIEYLNRNESPESQIPGAPQV